MSTNILFNPRLYPELLTEAAKLRLGRGRRGGPSAGGEESAVLPGPGAAPLPTPGEGAR
jgi:hypothetical protein